jgi:hypothetical protein
MQRGLELDQHDRVLSWINETAAAEKQLACEQTRRKYQVLCPDQGLKRLHGAPTPAINSSEQPAALLSQRVRVPSPSTASNRQRLAIPGFRPAILALSSSAHRNPHKKKSQAEGKQEGIMRTWRARALPHLGPSRPRV